MQPAPPSVSRTKSAVRLRQFTLRSFLVTLLIVAAPVGWMADRHNHHRHQRAMVREIEKAGGEALFDYQRTSITGEFFNGPPGPAILRHYLGHNAFAHIQAVRYGHWTKPGEHDLRRLAELPRLERVLLQSDRFSDTALTHLARCQSLENLSLTDTAATAEGLCQLAACPKLRRLSLAGSSITDETLASVATLSQLNEIELSRSQITSKGIDHLVQLPNLRRLEIYGAWQLDNSAMESLSRLQSLESLTLQNTSIRRGEWHRLCDLSRLSHLCVKCREFDDQAARQIAQIPTLNHLQLDTTAITDEGLVALSHQPNLVSLDISGGSITDKGILHLEHLPYLRSLKIRQVRTTECSLDSFARLQHLRHLELGHDAEGYELNWLRKELPDCNISYSPHAVFNIQGRQTF